MCSLRINGKHHGRIKSSLVKTQLIWRYTLWFISFYNVWDKNLSNDVLNTTELKIESNDLPFENIKWEDQCAFKEPLIKSTTAFKKLHFMEKIKNLVIIADWIVYFNASHLTKKSTHIIIHLLNSSVSFYFIKSNL